MKDHQRVALERGLAAFDRAVARRTRRRRIAGAVGAAFALVAVGVAAQLLALRWHDRGAGQSPLIAARKPLPTYVEIIHDDGQLVAELELASACERIGRTGGRMYVVECARGDVARPRR
ncbi:MAG: hypothetical protein U0572_01280 [Phycisphaerales bacterium]